MIKRRIKKLKLIRILFFMVLILLLGCYSIKNIALVTNYDLNKIGSGENSKSLIDNKKLSVDINSYDMAGLKKLCTTNNEVQDIIDNIKKYPKDIIDLLVRNPETIDYVKGYLEKYPQKYVSNDIELDINNDNGIPHYLQWDKRWGYLQYGGSPFAINGCGPTALSMVLVGLKGDTTMNPYEVARFAEDNDYFIKGKGTKWSLMEDGAISLGLEAQELPLDANIIKKKLKANNPIIAIMGRGDFTTSGHYIVLVGLDDDEKVIVRDPNSISRTNQVWDISIFMKQTRNLWSYSD